MEGGAKYAYERPDYHDSGARTFGKYRTAHPGTPASVSGAAPSGAPGEPTVSRDFGPFFVQLAPFRGVLTPMGHVGRPPGSSSQAAPGEWLLIRGTVRSTGGRYLAYATLDVWQAGPEAQYDYEEKDGQFRPYMSYIDQLNDHSTSREYQYRCRVLTDEVGRFEYQTVIPPPYLDPEDNTWRCPHIHHFIQADGCLSCVTQIMFPGMEKNDTDNHIRRELLVDLVRGQSGTHWEGRPEFVLKEEEI